MSVKLPEILSSGESAEFIYIMGDWRRLAAVKGIGISSKTVKRVSMVILNNDIYRESIHKHYIHLKKLRISTGFFYY